MKGAQLLIVLDRCISSGLGGPVFSEIRSALYDEEPRPKVVGIIGGLGGRDMPEENFDYVINRGREIAEKGSDRMLETVGIR